MKPNICFYFQVHQPFRLKDLRFNQLGEKNENYFDEKLNKDIFRKIADKCYLPSNKLLMEIIKQYPDFKVAFSLSGVFLEQCELYGQDVLKSFQKLVDTGNVELLAETYYHSLSSVLSLSEFVEQINLHVLKIEELFNVTPDIFRNTELIYNNHIAEIIRLLGFKGVLTEGVDHILAGRNPNMPYAVPAVSLSGNEIDFIRDNCIHVRKTNRMNVLLKNYQLSDDIAFRFSNRSWKDYPLTAEKFTDWISGSEGHIINLFMDYETFGEHQWPDTGIFNFLKKLPEIWEKKQIKTLTPCETLDTWEHPGNQEYNVHEIISWADMERDLSAWKGNEIQNAALESVYSLEKDIKKSKNPDLLHTWRKLQVSDHFYYMCTKYWNDGDVHKYFSPYKSPYEAYRRFSHALWDLRDKISLLNSNP